MGWDSKVSYPQNADCRVSVKATTYQKGRWETAARLHGLATAGAFLAWAGDMHLALQRALSERTAVMRTEPIERPNFAVDVADCVELIASHKFHNFAGREVGHVEGCVETERGEGRGGHGADEGEILGPNCQVPAGKQVRERQEIVGRLAA